MSGRAGYVDRDGCGCGGLGDDGVGADGGGLGGDGDGVGADGGGVGIANDGSKLCLPGAASHGVVAGASDHEAGFTLLQNAKT
jgi:hypothetical protein